MKAAAAGSSLLLGGAGLRALAQDAVPAALSASRLSDSLVLVGGAGANVLVKQTGGELLVVDGGLAAHALALLEKIRAETGSEDITTLVNTHWHREQTGLNEILGARGAAIFAHENTRLWLGAEIERPWEDKVFEPLPEPARPNETFYHYGELAHGGQPVRYGYLRQAHTDGDMYVHFPEDNVLHAGGAVSSAGWPLIDWWTGGWIGGLVEAHDTLLAVADDATTIVPAHGPVLTRAELSAMRDMYATVYQRLRQGFNAANSPAEQVAAGHAAEFEDKMGNADMFILMAHQSLVPHITPDA